MIITIIADIYGEENNGTVATTNRLINGMIARGHKIRLVTTFQGKNTDNLTYYVVKPRNFLFLNKYINKNGAEFASPDKEVLKKAISGSDVVHMLIPFKLSKAAVKITKELKVPHTSAFHTQPENITEHLKLRKVQFLNEMFFKRFKRHLYTHHHFIHCPSNFTKNEISVRGYTGDLRVISNGVDNTLFYKNKQQKPENLKDKFVIISCGRFSKEKRHDLIIEAVKLSKYEDKIQLIFTGKGPLKDKLIKHSRQLKNPTIFGFYSRPDLAKTLNYSDLYIHASEVENESIACLEAITCGLVPIISDSKKSASGQFALYETNLFKAGDAKNLAEKIDYWIEHPELKEKVSEEYSKYTKKFYIDNCLDEMEKFFFDAVEYYKNLYNNK